MDNYGAPGQEAKPPWSTGLPAAHGSYIHFLPMFVATARSTGGSTLNQPEKQWFQNQLTKGSLIIRGQAHPNRGLTLVLLMAALRKKEGFVSEMSITEIRVTRAGGTRYPQVRFEQEDLSIEGVEALAHEWPPEWCVHQRVRVLRRDGSEVAPDDPALLAELAIVEGIVIQRLVSTSALVQIAHFEQVQRHLETYRVSRLQDGSARHRGL